jgi:hypothetical protein
MKTAIFVNSSYFPEQHQTTVLYDGERLCFLWGMDLIFEYYLDKFWDLKG